MAGAGYLEVCVSVFVIVMGAIAVISIGFVHQKVHRVERMKLVKRSDADIDGNTEMANMNSGNWFDVAQVIPDIDIRDSSIKKKKGLDEGDRITVFEDVIQSLLTEQAKWMTALDKKFKQDEKPAQDMRGKRAMDDCNKTKETNTDGDHIYTVIGNAVYIRWGRSLCPTETELMYDSVTAGSHYDLQRTAANTLCLPKNHVWGKYGDRINNYSLIFGAEYKLWSSKHQTLFKLQNAEQLCLHNVLCALCRSQTRTSVFMLSGRNHCYKGWHTEYHGYSTGCHHGHKSPPEYICVDEAPEEDPAGYRDEGGKLLIPVEAVCGCLPCPPYVAGRELTCAICSK